jgi:hypothetical protein
MYSPSKKTEKKQKQRAKPGNSDLYTRQTASHKAYERQQKDYHNGERDRLTGPGGYLFDICTVNVTVPGPSNYQPVGGHSTLGESGGRFNVSKSKTYVEQYIYDHREVPGPADRQPVCGSFATSIAMRSSAENTSTGGRFNKDKSKDFLEQHIYDKRYVPAPTDNQPEFGVFATSIAHVTSPTHNPASGRFGASKSKNYAEQQIYDKRDVPAPGVYQPEGGWSVYENSGSGKFNMSMSKNYIEQHIYEKKDVPLFPEQPAFGKFGDSIAKRTEPTNKTIGGSFNASYSKNYIAQHVYDKLFVPAPTAYTIKSMCFADDGSAQEKAREDIGRSSGGKGVQRGDPSKAQLKAADQVVQQKKDRGHLIGRRRPASAGADPARARGPVG